MSETIQTDFFVQNRKRLRELFTGTAPIILTANGLLQRNGDSTFPFRQDSSFWYFTGIELPDVVLVMDKAKEYLIIPERDTSREAFDGHIEAEKLSAVSGVETVLADTVGWKQLGTRLKKVKHVATLAPAPGYVAQHGLYTNPARARLLRQIKQHNSDIKLLDLRTHITRLRAIKQPVELAQIEEAIRLTGSALKKVQRNLSKYEFEYEAEAVITAAFRSHNAQHAYSPIVAAGANACTLHYVENGDVIPKYALILFDVGAEVSHYAADITRTYAVTTPSARQQQVFDAVQAVQAFAVDLLKPGVLMRDYEKSVHHFMGEKLRELGLIKNIEADSVRKYYPHATSHFLGLDVHDVGDYELPLEAGMVLTVEPGIYIPEEGIGIRLEDNVLIEENGAKILSGNIPCVLS